MSWENLEKKTLWDITTNGSPFELMWVSVACSFLAVMYSIIRVYFWVKYKTRELFM